MQLVRSLLREERSIPGAYIYGIQRASHIRRLFRCRAAQDRITDLFNYYFGFRIRREYTIRENPLEHEILSSARGPRATDPARILEFSMRQQDDSIWKSPQTCRERTFFLTLICQT